MTDVQRLMGPTNHADAASPCCSPPIHSPKPRMQLACTTNTQQQQSMHKELTCMSPVVREEAASMEKGKANGAVLPLPSAAHAPNAASFDRLAAVNQFTLNKDEPQRSLQELVQALEEELSTGKKDLNRLYNIMMSYDYSGNEWKRFEFWNEQKKYTRNLIAHVPNCFALMLLCWNPGTASPIHNHSGSECFMRVIQGEIVEKQYVVKGGEGDEAGKANWSQSVCANIPASDLTLTHTNHYLEGGCTFINDSLGVHAVVNPRQQPCVTLHAYIPGYESCKAWCEDGNSQGDQVKVLQCHISYDTEQGERPHA